LQDKLVRAQRDLDEKEEAHSQHKMEEFGTGLENVIGLFSKSKRRLSTSLTKHRLTEQAKAAVDEAKGTLSDLQKQLTSLEQARQQALSQASERWAQMVDDVNEVPLTPLRKDVFLDLFGVIWLPYYVLQVGSEVIEFPAYE
jgi:RecB family exonuclease